MSNTSKMSRISRPCSRRRSRRRMTRGARRFEGTIVAIGPEVAFVDVGGKGEAVIEIDELKDADGALEVAVGDRIQAMVVSTAGGLTLSRKLARGAATDAAARGRVPGRSAGRRQGRAGGQGRLRGPHRPPARVLPALADRHRPHRRPRDARRPRLHVPDHRVQGRRPEPRRLAARAARRGAAGERRRGPPIDRPRRGADRPRRLGARLRRVRRSRRRRAGPAPRLRDGLVARGGHVAGRHGRRGDHRQGAARGRRHAEDRARPEAAHRGSVVDGRRHATRSGQVRTGRVTRVAEFGAFVELEPGVEGAGARLHVRADRPTRRLGAVGRPWA